MIRCPRCGLEWSQGTLTCPKDGTRLYERVSGRNQQPTPRQERQLTPIDTAPLGAGDTQPTTTEAPAQSLDARAMLNPPSELQSGNKRALLVDAGRLSSGNKPLAYAANSAAVAELERPRVTGPRPAAAPPVQALPYEVPPDQKNPWGDEKSGGTDSTMRRVRETPKTQLDSPKDPLIGVKLGEYKVLDQLGSGGMGIVYRGEQPLIGKQVAIKVLRPELASDPRQVQRLVDEARAVNAVHHPGLINIFSFGETPDGAKYFVMDLLEGQSVEELLHARGKLKAWEAVPILEGALSALDAAHGAGVIHRDLKPSNIFLVDLPDHTHLVKLLDFGLAKLGAARGSTPQTMNVVVGTPEYMAPEQARALDISPRTDIYAMGIVAYELLTGDVPFSCESAVETLMMQLDVVPKPAGDLEPTIPPPLEKLVMRMLSKRPEDRPSSAAEVKRELGRIKRQLTNAETQIAQAAAIRAEPEAHQAETIIPPPPGARPVAPPPTSSASVETFFSAPPPGSQRFAKTDVMPPVSEAMLESRAASSTERMMTAPRPKPWLLPAAIGAGAVMLLAAAYVAFLRRPPVEPVVVPPPPPNTSPLTPKPRKLEQPPPPVAAPNPPPPTPLQDPVKKPRPDQRATPPKKPELVAPKPNVHTKQEVLQRLERLLEQSKTNPKPEVQRLMERVVPHFRKQLDSTEVTPDDTWKQLDEYEDKLK